MNLAIVGGTGLIGSTTAFLAGQKGIFDTVRILGRRKNVLESQAMDMEHALLPYSNTKVIPSDYSDIGDCDIIVVTVSAPLKEAASREDYLYDNIPIIDNVAENIKKYSNGAVVITVTNPIDVFNYYLWQKIGWDKKYFLGFSANDELRVKWALAKKYDIDFSNIECFCMGEHGEAQVPITSKATYNGKALEVSHKDREEIKCNVLNWFTDFQKLKGGRTSGWTSSVMLLDIIEAIVGRSHKTIECSVILDGPKYKDISIGMPVKLCKNGIKEIIMPDIDDAERAEFDIAVNKIAKQIESIKK